MAEDGATMTAPKFLPDGLRICAYRPHEPLRVVVQRNVDCVTTTLLSTFDDGLKNSSGACYASAEVGVGEDLVLVSTLLMNSVRRKNSQE